MSIKFLVLEGGGYFGFGGGGLFWVWVVFWGEVQQLRFGVFREGVFQKMPALEGQFLKEISVRFAGENHLRTQKNTKQSSAQRFLNDPFPKTPLFSAAEKCRFYFLFIWARGFFSSG